MSNICKYEYSDGSPCGREVGIAGNLFCSQHRPSDGERIKQLEAELAAVRSALEHDRTKVAECVTAVTKELQSYDWLISSRGSHSWDDNRWHGEFKTAHDAIETAIQPMVKIAADWSNCPKSWEEVQKAREGEGQ